MGEFPHDKDIGFEPNRRGIRRKLATIRQLENMSVDERAQKLAMLYRLKEVEIRTDNYNKNLAEKVKKREKKRMTFKAAAGQWLEEIKSTNSVDTWKHYSHTIGIYVDTVGNHPLSEFSREKNIKFFKALKNRISVRSKTPISNATQNKHMRHLQAFINWAYDLELIDRQYNLKKAPVPKKDMDTVDIADLELVGQYLQKNIEEAQTEEEKFNAENLFRAYKLAANSLLRLGPIWSLKLERIDLDKRIIKIRDNPELEWVNKKFKWPNKPMNDALFTFLKADLASRPPEHRYFLDNGHGEPWYKQRGDITKAMKKVFVKIGFPNIKPFHHGFRASMITELLTQGVDPKSVQQLADHDSLETTLLYLNTRKVSQESAVNALPGL